MSESSTEKQHLRLGFLRRMAKEYQALHPEQEIGLLHVYTHTLLEPDVRMLPFFLSMVRRGVDHYGNETELGHVERFVLFTGESLTPVKTADGVLYPVVMFDGHRTSYPLLRYVSQMELDTSEEVVESAPPAR